MSEILQPCPFCGGTKICTEKGINLNYCDNCSAESNIEHWNTRPIEDELKARIAELEEAKKSQGLLQRWIPVSERLPEGRTVLVFKKDGSISIDTTYIDGGNYFWWESGQSKVTHWMLLPEPPIVYGKESEE